MNGFKVTETIEGAHPLLPNYPLLPGDLLVQDSGGTFMKEAPGIAVGGFQLSHEDILDRLEEVEFTRHGLEYTLGPES